MEPASLGLDTCPQSTWALLASRGGLIFESAEGVHHRSHFTPARSVYTRCNLYHPRLSWVMATNSGFQAVAWTTATVGMKSTFNSRSCIVYCITMRRFGQPHEEGVIVANIDDCAARLICLAEKLVRVNPDLSFAAGIVVNTAIRLAGGEPQAIQTSRFHFRTGGCEPVDLVW